MVDEHVLRTDNAQTGGPHPEGEVVVLEHSGLEALVERPDPPPGVTAHRHAEHRQHGDVGALTDVATGAFCGVVEHLLVRPIRRVDLRLVARPVGDRPHQADRGIAQVSGQP